MSIEADQAETKAKTTVEVKARYQPSPARFENEYPRSTTLAPVKTDVMGFFRVAERTEGRKVYTYHLFYQGQPQDDLAKTLGGLVGERREEIEFQLVEQIVES